jgi:ubiquinone biosynthesis UbiH/UbiF/VisC/COQ6 family hydroxylase
LLRDWEVWPEEDARMAAVVRMLIFGDRPGSRLSFDAYEAHVSKLATIVENSVLLHAMRAALDRDGRVRRFSAARCTKVEWLADAACLTLDDVTTLRGKLLAAADGADSWLRTQAGIAVSEVSYGQTAVVANFECARPHDGTAFQWFRPDGVLALLPLPGQRVSIVWSARDDLAARLMMLSPEDLAREVEAACGERLGSMTLITGPARFALRNIRVHRLIGPRLALVGDAAHNFHPLAGQGVNVGFQDAHTLAAVLEGRGPETDVGAVALLRRYERARREEIAAMSAVTHGLQVLFNQAGTPFAWLRNLGLNLTDRSPPLKAILVARALGSPSIT